MGFNNYLKNYHEYFNTLNIIFYLGIGIPLILFIVFYLQFEREGTLSGPSGNFDIFLHMIIPLLALGIIYAAYRYSMIKTRALDQYLPFKSKLYEYFRVLLGKYIILAIACLIIVITFYFTQQKIFSIFYTITLVVFTLNRPKDRDLVKDLKLTPKEREKLYSQEDY